MTKWLLALAGVCVAVYFYGYQSMPAPDLISFLEIGRSLWHGHLPSQFQRGPVLGLIVYPMSLAIGAVTSCLLLNALLYVLSLVLLERVARIWLPRASVLVAMVCMCNPWVVEMMTRTLCETALTFLVLLTFWLALVKKSRWSWVVAMLATMTRADTAGLFLMLLIWQGRPWAKTVLYAALTALPLAIWTYLGQTGTAFHYSQIMQADRVLEASGWLSCTQMVIWPIPPTLPLVMVFWLLCIGAIARCWALGCFAVPYCLIHASYPFQEPRMWTPVAWALVIMAYIGCAYAYAWRPRLAVLACGAVIGLSLLTLAPRVMQYGTRDHEFKQLIEWQRNNIPNDKVATSLFPLLNLIEPGAFVPIGDPNARYVAWDSRFGLAVDKDVWKNPFKGLEGLSQTKSQGKYQYLTSIPHPTDRKRWINVFRIKE